jgi:hypothetical protein
MECSGITDFDNNSRLITLSAIIISGLHCITDQTEQINAFSHLSCSISQQNEKDTALKVSEFLHLHKNQQMYPNYRFVVTLRCSNTFRRPSAIIRELTRSSQATCRYTCNVHRQVACEHRVSSLMMALVRRNMQKHLIKHHNKVTILMYLLVFMKIYCVYQNTRSSH